jgi:tetratricopeptide (TPR) repeat protein
MPRIATSTLKTLLLFTFRKHFPSILRARLFRGRNMSQIARIPSLQGCQGRAPIGASATFALALLLAACQGGMSPDENASGQTSTALLKVADETRAGGDLGTAVGLYRRVHEKRPTDPKPLEKLGSTLTQMGAYTEAAEAFHAGLDLAKDDPDLHRGLAVVLLSLNQPGPAASEAKAREAQ